VEEAGYRAGRSRRNRQGTPRFEIADLPPEVEVRQRISGAFDVMLLFFTRRAELERRFPLLLRALDVAGGLWIAWPKRAAGVASDITEDVVREVALPTGMVDNKVCAIDDTWSGLRLVLRRELRTGRTSAAS